MRALIEKCHHNPALQKVLRIDAVISSSASAQGLQFAKKTGLATRVVESAGMSRESFDKKLHEALQETGCNFICCAGFMRVLTADFVRLWHNKIINIHPSLLPKFKGLNVHARVLDSGEKTTGCTVHVVREKVDDGPILGQKTVAVKKTDTPQTLAARVLQKEHILYAHIVQQLARGTLSISGDSVSGKDPAKS